MQFNVIIAIICIIYGIRFATRGQGLRSKPRVLIGIAMVLVGTAQFLKPVVPMLGNALAVLAIVFLVAGMIMMRRQIGR